MAFAESVVNFKPSTGLVGVPPINSTLLPGNGGTPQVAGGGFQPLTQLGRVIEAYDPNFGVGEFIYLLGLVATVAGDLVIYDEGLASATTRAITTSRGPVAIAMADNVAGQYGWYQVKGAGLVNTAANAVAANAPIYATAAPGVCDDAVVATAKVDGMTSKAANGATLATFTRVQLDRPALNGNG